jgi:hypothetical protein
MLLSEERLRILRMVQTGAITAEEGAGLLAGMQEQPVPQGQTEPGGKARWLHACVTDLVTGRLKVDVRLPVGLVDIGIKMGAQFLPGASDVTSENLLKSIREGQVGKVADVEDTDNDERVEIFIE